MKVGIIGAMEEEVNLLVEELHEARRTSVAGIAFYEGKLEGVGCVVVWGGDWGKVAAASCAQMLAHVFSVDHMIVIGVAGALDEDLEVGDVVVCKETCQYDFKVGNGPLELARSIGLPLRAGRRYESDFRLREITVAACTDVLTKKLASIIEPETLALFGIKKPKVVVGTILSGDEVVEDKQRKVDLREKESGTCIEMEGAAIAQVCDMNGGIPFIIIRAISDKADETVETDFLGFVKHLSGKYSCAIVREILRRL